MRIHFGLALSACIVGFVTLAPAPAPALELPDAPWGPITIGPVTLDPHVSVDPDGVDVDADASVSVPNLPPLDLGVSTGVDDGGISGDVRLPGAPPLQVPEVPEPVPGVLDGLLPESEPAPAPTSPVPGGPPAAGVPADRPPGVPHTPSPAVPAVPDSAAPLAATNERALDGEAAVSGELVSPRPGIWSTIGHAAVRFGPWFALIALVLVVHFVARSALRERLLARPS